VAADAAGSLVMNTIKLHWSRGKPNFGDWLSPAICQRLSGATIEYAKPNNCDLVAIGSVLDRLNHGWFARKTHVWGAGFIESQKPVKAQHEYHAVRGHKTAELIRGADIKAFGDPGLLADLLLPERGAKQYRLAIIPHYKEREHPAVKTFVANNSNAVTLDVFSDVMDLLRAISSCDFVLSSSLHGLIVADAFNVPNAWLKISENIRGADFKFFDYYSIFGFENPKPVNLDPSWNESRLEELKREYQRPNLNEIKRKLIEAFPFPAAV
jgi:pyruvyltransferase